jgi:hypothetical protein
MNGFEPHGDDVLSVGSPALTPVNNQTLKVSQLIEAFKGLQNSAYRTWYEQGIECEFLGTSGGTGWQTGRIRVRFEFIPDVPDEPEINLDSTALAPLSDQLAPDQQ